MYSLKILEQDDETVILGGYGVVFGGEDLEGETFAADTDFMLDLVPVKPVYIDHAGDSFVTADGKTIKLVGVNEPVGQVVEVTADEIGLYMKLQLEKAGRYWSVVEQMIGTGKAGLSSGTVGHLARRNGKAITRWPIVEESITLTPAEPRTVGVERLKALAELNPDLQALAEQEFRIPEAAGTAAADEATDGVDEAGADETDATEHAAASEGKTRIEITEEVEMSGDNAQAQADPRDEEIKSLSDRVNQLIELMEKSPAMKSAGYTTDDGGTADPSHKSFGDWLLAVKRNDTKRLQTVYGSTKDMAEAAGTSGGYLVPTEHLSPLLQVAADQSPIYQRVTKVPVTRDAGEWPALDHFAAPTAGAGNTAYAGRVTSATTAEGAALTETQPQFVNLEWRIHKLGGYVEVSNELIADSPVSIEALLRSLFGIAIAAKNERNILRGSGAGEPLGIFNSSAAIGVTTATNDVFALADALSMRSRFKAFGGGTPVWVIHPGMWSDIGVFETSAGGAAWMANSAMGMPQSLLGYPIIESEHMPAPNTDDVLLADLSAYVLFERQALSIAYSEHAAFTTDKGTWRFTARNDGQPWLKNVVTLADPGGSHTVSAFVYHND